MKYVTLSITGLWLLAVVGCDATSTLDDDLDYVVVEAYLYTEKNVEDIRLTSPIPMTEEDTTGPPINDATVRLIKEEQTFALVSSGDDGYYHYPGEDLTVEEGDHFRLEVDHFGRTAFAETIVPPAPEKVTLTRDTMYVHDPSQGGGCFRCPPGGPLEIPSVEWPNPDGLPFLVMVESTEEDPEPIINLETRPPLQVTTQPTTQDAQSIGYVSYLGQHEATVYRVNTEYEELYEYQEQDSRFLNDPPSNVTNGVGIFTAFSGRSKPFTVAFY